MTNQPTGGPDAAPVASVEFVGTATTVLRLGPFTLLTDPNFLHRGQRAWLGYGLMSKRLSEPSLQVEQLPALDGVVLSHLHGDHFDRVARRGLARELPVVTTGEAADRLRRWGFGGARELGTWESTEMRRDGWTLRITSTPGTHGPGPVARVLPDVMGSVYELFSGEGASESELVHRLWVSGDTLRRPFLREVVDRHGPLDAAVLHLGGTRVLGLLVTMDARQGADVVQMLEPGVTVPVHYDDYTVFRSSLGHFVDEWRLRRLPGELRVVQRGETASLVRTS
ncbi:MBL fold metallo-hydrolase [Pseudokineococcus basanitobsidens]|uniref:MBL fold metallo-hydrolase n=1 Tax=Pseudokineococcus basanitobsidens TaxID=1926649 RepID=A0ABU8RKK4_9ACTN